MSRKLYLDLIKEMDLPEMMAEEQLAQLLERFNITPEGLTEEILRDLVAELLQETLLDLKKELSN